MRLATIRQYYGESHYLRNLFDEVDKLADVTTFSDHVQGNGPESLSGFAGLTDLHIDEGEFDAILWFPTYQRMSVLPPFDWGKFKGRKILLDFDVCQNYSTISSMDRLGTYASELRRHHIDTIVVSGRAVRDRLREEGFDAIWMPSATDPTFFAENSSEGCRVVHFGTRYPARRVMLREMERCRLRVEHINCERAELPDLLSQVGIGVICDMQARSKVAIPKRFFRRLPSVAYRALPGIEPMMKQYEYASAGVTLVCDRQPDREFLGFIDRETCFDYQGIAGATEALRAAIAEFEGPGHVATAAKSMTLKWHTWARRAPALLAACNDSATAYLDSDYRPK